MNIYKITFQDPEWGQSMRWAKNKRDAKRILREIKASYGESTRVTGIDSGLYPYDIRAVIVPTDKAGLIDFLNTHATSNEVSG